MIGSTNVNCCLSSEDNGNEIPFEHHENVPIYFYPLKPHFYTVKLGFTGVHIIFLIFPRNHRLWVFIRTATRQGGSNEYRNLCFEQKYEKYWGFI